MQFRREKAWFRSVAGKLKMTRERFSDGKLGNWVGDCPICSKSDSGKSRLIMSNVDGEWMCVDGCKNRGTFFKLMQLSAGEPVNFTRKSGRD